MLQVRHAGGLWCWQDIVGYTSGRTVSSFCADLTIARSLLQNLFLMNYAQNIEDSFRKQILVDEVLCLVETLDCEDGEEYLGLRDAYIRNSHGFVFVYSITSRASFEKIEHFYNSVLRLKGEHPVGIIVGNKRDKSNQRAVTTEEGRELAVRLGCEFAETSAKTADNVDKLFPDLIRVIRHLSVHEPLEPSDPSHSHRSGDRRPDRNVISALFGRLRRR
ncbi:Ras GTPase ras2 [Pleurotus pulmonarius]|nr:Ras GTPase ras2 [Pleurotus pulmonarius]